MQITVLEQSETRKENIMTKLACGHTDEFGMQDCNQEIVQDYYHGAYCPDHPDDIVNSIIVAD